MRLTYRRYHPSDLSKLTALPDSDKQIFDEESLAQYGWVAENTLSELMGYSYLQIIHNPTTTQIWLYGDTHPDASQLEIWATLLQHQWAEVTRLAEAVASVTINAWLTYQSPAGLAEILQDFGLKPYHIYTEMRLNLTDFVAEFPAASSDVIVKAWSMADCEAAVNLRNRAFADSWGYQPTTPTALQRRFQTGRYQPQFSFTAWHNQAMVGVLHGHWQPQSAQGEAVWLAVAPHHQGKGIGQALMTRLINQFRQVGATAINLSSDHAADSVNNRLYERLGFQIVNRVVDYQMVLANK